MSRASLFAMAAVLACVAGQARASVIDTCRVEFAGDTAIDCTNQGTSYPNTYHTISWSVDGAGAGFVNITDHSNVSTADWHKYFQNIDGDPITTLSTMLYNDSDVDWIGYTISVVSNTPGVTVVFSGTPTSSGALLDTPALTSSTIQYSGLSTHSPLLVNGDYATLGYTLTITPPQGFRGQVSYTITSTPVAVPEAASMLLLAPAALGLLARRRR